MGQFRCRICDDPIWCKVIDEELRKPVSKAYIARLMTARGFAVSPALVSSHDKHKASPDDLPATTPAEKPATARRDAAVYLRDKMLDQVEARSEEKFEDGRPKLDLLDKHLQPALKTILIAQDKIDKRESRTDDRKTSIALAMILSGAMSGGPPPHLQIEDGNTIEGDFEEVV